MRLRPRLTHVLIQRLLRARQQPQLAQATAAPQLVLIGDRVGLALERASPSARASYEPLALTRRTPIELPEQGDVLGVIARMDSIGQHVTEVRERVTTRSPDLMRPRPSRSRPAFPCCASCACTTPVGFPSKPPTSSFLAIDTRSPGAHQLIDQRLSGTRYVREH
jgi:hypothetical protein